MKGRALALALLLAVGFAAWNWWPAGGPALAAGEPRRNLGDYRAVNWPEGLPATWRGELERRLAAAPRIALLDSGAEEAAREVLRGVSWIDPDSVRADLEMPAGIRVAYKARVPALRVLQGGEPVAFIATDGSVLPLGALDFESGLLPDLRLDGTTALLPGRRVADAVVGQALLALPEFFALRRHAGLDLVRIERSPVFPAEAAVPPPLMFVTRTGRQIIWGRPRAARHPQEIPLNRKLQRLKAIMDKYPGLEEVQRVHVDRPMVFATGRNRAPLPLPPDLR